MKIIKEYINFERGIDPKVSMKIIKENINFERGLDPKKTMGLGLFSIIKKELRNLYRKYLGYDEELGELNNVYDLAGVIDTTPFDIGLPNDDKDPIWIYIGYRGNRRNLFEKDIEWAEPYINYKKYWRSPYNDDRDTGYARVKPEYKDIFRIFLDNKNFLDESLNFERELDPKASMKIGMPSWNNLHEGDLIKVIKNIPLTRENVISRFAAVSDLPAGVILQVSWLDNASSKEWVLWFKYFVDLKDFNANKNDNVRSRHGFVKATPKQFRNGPFEFLPRSMSEAQEFRRGGDPMVSMNIGKRALIEKWLNEHDLLEDTVISKDLIINTAKDCQLLIRLRNIGEALPEYIQFGTVIGGFDISDNQLKTLRGCPKKVIGTENFKGNFKCQNNNLMTLDNGPKYVDGNYVCHNNPGLFSQKDIRKVCRVKGSAWGDEPQEIVNVPVKENMEFHRNINPKSSLDIGYHAQIKNWFKECGISEDPNDDKYVEYRINKDGTIDVLDDLNLVDCHINNFPYFIKFKIIYGGFYVAQNIFTKLDGFPKEVKGDLSIYSSYPGSKKWKEDEIRKKIKVLGTVWN